MKRRSPFHRTDAVLLAMAGVLMSVGCAGIPRIDPSGRSLLIWPEPTPAPVAAPDGNFLAPPVLGDSGSLCPLCPLGNCLSGSVDSVAGPIARGVAKPAETLRITPDRVLAPIGSEVILRASVCGPNEYLRTNRRIEWMLGGEGTGQFVTVGEQGEMDILRFPWQRPNKHDNTYAVGYTSPFHTCLNRGTADASDDVQVRPGDAWITVTSASEGVSYVTAHAPETGNWDTRRNRATIYWIDAQWAIPPSAMAQPGTPYTLTTTVTRQSDGAPVAGWIVRYEVLDGPTARLGYEAGQTSEATTDANGHASIEVSPTDDQPGSTRIGVTISRPAQSAPMASPRLDIGGGETIITWTPSATFQPGLPPSLPGSTDGGTVPPVPYEPPPQEPRPIDPAAAPQLEVKIRRESTGTIQQGDSIPVAITVINNGDAVARDVSITDRFEAGLTTPLDTEQRGSVTYPAPGSGSRFPDLAPGESDIVRLELTALSPGRQCHEVTATALGAEPAFDRQCFEIEAPAPPPSPTLELVAQGELRREVGQVYRFKSRVYNRGSVPATNVRVQIAFEGPLKPQFAEQGHRLLSNGFAWDVASLEAGGSIPFEVEFLCQAPTRSAKVTVFAKADQTSELVKNAEVEIVPARSTPSGGNTAAPAQSMQGSIVATPASSRVGNPGVLELALTNRGTTELRNVEFRLIDEQAKLRLRLAPGQSSIPFSANQNTLQFGPVASLTAGETVRVSVPFDALSQGEAPLRLEARSEGVPIFNAAEMVLSIGAR